MILHTRKLELINKSVLFTLFHHDINYQNSFLNFDTQYLYNLSKSTIENEIKEIANTLFSICTYYIGKNKDSDITLTLTGGMDSRIILAALLKADIKPNCLTFGNSKSKDVILANNLAENFGLHFHNACPKLPNKDWYYTWVVQTIKRDYGNANLHRAHRTAAIAEHNEIFQPKVLFTGHMGGEGIRGLSYNNYFSSPFFEYVNEGKMTVEKAASIVLDEYFLKTKNINWAKLKHEVLELPWMKNDKETNKFFFLYDLVAKIHHAQDLRIFQSYVPSVVPVYLHKDYLEKLFSSKYHFLAKEKGVLGKLQNPYIYCKIIEYLYPALLDYPLANGFTPKEYLKGLWYYVPVKLYRDRINKKKYPPTFSYGQWYIDFVKEHAQNISPDIWEIYDKKRYFKALKENQHGTDEGYWHKFSNPIFFDLVQKYQKGML